MIAKSLSTRCHSHPDVQTRKIKVKFIYGELLVACLFLSVKPFHGLCAPKAIKGVYLDQIFKNGNRFVKESLIFIVIKHTQPPPPHTHTSY